MFGGAGFSLRRRVRAAVGLCPSEEGLVLVHLCVNDETGGAWTVTEARTSAAQCPAAADAEALAAVAYTELRRAGWERLPIGLALPLSEVHTEERELPVPLTGAELRAALMWSLRAEADETGTHLPHDLGICCAELSGTEPTRYWTAQLEGARIRQYFSAFAAAGLQLRRLTVCPAGGGVLAAAIEEARGPCMPWEAVRHDDGCMPAVYAGLLVRSGMSENLYWTAEQALLVRLRSRAAPLIAVLSTAVFLVCVGAELSSCMTARAARDRAVEELALRESERLRMETFFVLRSDVMQREQMLAAFAAESLPLRALLIHLGSKIVDGVYLTGVRAAEQELWIEGEAVSYAALASFMGAMEDDDFFSAEVTLEQAGEERETSGMPPRIRFTLHSDWQEGRWDEFQSDSVSSSH